MGIDGSDAFTLLPVEDLHWAHEATLDFLRFADLRFREALALSNSAIFTAFETDTTEQIGFHQCFKVHHLDRLGGDEALATAQEPCPVPWSALTAIVLRLAVARIDIWRNETDGAAEQNAIVELLDDEEDARHICDVHCLTAQQ